MFLWNRAAESNNNSETFTLRKNETDCNIVITLVAGAFSGMFADTTHTCTVAVGDRIDLKIMCNANVACAAVDGASVAFKATSGGCNPATATNCNTLVAAVINFTATAGTTTYFAPLGKNSSTTETSLRWGLARAGTLSGCYAYVKTASSGGNTTTLTAMKNGVAGSSTVTISNGTTGSVAGTGSDVYTRGDGFSMKIVSTGGVGPVIASYGCAYQ